MAVSVAVALSEIVPEIELGAVAVKVGLGAVLVDAAHTPFEDGERAFDRFGVDGRVFRIDVAVPSVVYFLVRGEGLAHRRIDAGLIGHENRVRRHVGVQKGRHAFGAHLVHHEAALGLGGPVEHRHHLHLVVEGPLDRRARLKADVGLIHFDNSAANAERGQVAGLHRFPDPVRQEPSRLEPDPQDAMQLGGADTLLGRAHQEHGLKPQVHRQV